MNKTKLQQELKEKIKPGIKPSKLKSLNKNEQSEQLKKKDEENKASFTHGIPTPPDSPILKPIGDNNSLDPISLTDEENIHNPKFNPYIGKVKELQEGIDFWSQTANNHLHNLQKLTAENDILTTELKELQPSKSQQELELALKEANNKIRKLQGQEDQ